MCRAGGVKTMVREQARRKNQSVTRKSRGRFSPVSDQCVYACGRVLEVKINLTLLVDNPGTNTNMDTILERLNAQGV